MWVPVVVKRVSMNGPAQLPKFEEDMDALKDEDAFLIPTAEVPLTKLYRDEILPESELPKSFTAYSPCFRREAGAAGKDTPRLLPGHQVAKGELLRYGTPPTPPGQTPPLTGPTPKEFEAVGAPASRPQR